MSTSESRKVMVIGKPYVIDSENGKVRLCADITLDEKRTLYYEVDKEYKQFLCEDRLDAFLVGLLHTAMFEDIDIECEAPVTEQLLFQLNTYYIPTLADNMSNMFSITIKAQPTTEVVENAKAVGTGNSGGVDSLYTMLKYSNKEFGSYKLTHVMFNNVSTEDTDEERIRALFERDCIEKKKSSEELNLKFIGLFTNLYSFYRHPGVFNHFFAPQYVSAVYALAKLFSVYYFSSTFEVNKFSMDEKVIHSGGRFDLFTLDCCSTSFLKVYSAGAEVDRMGKTNYIINKEFTQKHLQVCAVEQSFGGSEVISKLNCGWCHKCSRTISILYAYRLLDKYADIFDLTLFNKNRAKFIGRALAIDQKSFALTVKDILKKEKLMPRNTMLWYRFYKFRTKLTHYPKLVALYRKIKRK